MRWLMVFICTGMLWAQQGAKNLHKEDDCGDPASESQTFVMIYGRVEKVLSGDQILIRFSPYDQSVVQLPCIRAPRRGEPGFFESRAALRHLIGARRDLEIYFPGFVPKLGNQVIAMVQDWDWSEKLLGQGHGRFVPSYGYAINSYGECRCRKAEERARASHLGIWAGRKLGDTEP